MYSFSRTAGSYEGRPVASGATPSNPTLDKSSFSTKAIDHPNRIILVNPVFKALRKQHRLAPINPLNEAPHPIPPPKSGGIIQRESNNQVRFHTSRVKTGSALVEHKISASPPKPDICALMSTRTSLASEPFNRAYLD